MKKILISDYFGSLITPDPNEINQLYHTNFDCSDENAINVQNFAISNLKPDLEEFLYDGNELVIVTNLGHCTMDWFIEHWLGKTLKLFTKYVGQIKVFLHDEILEEHISSYVNKNNCFYLVENEYIFQILKRKSEVFNYLDLKNKLLFSMGDSTHDIDMLVKNIQLGGISSLIDYSLLFDGDYNDNEILFNYACRKRELQQTIEEYQKHRDFTCDITFNEEYRNLQFQMISEQYRNGVVNIEDICKKSMIYNLFSTYYFLAYNIQAPIFDIEKIEQYYNSRLLVNSSFNEFYQEVIKKVYKKND